jgi:DinB superfamily
MLTIAQKQSLIEKIRLLSVHVKQLVDGLSPEQLTTHYLSGEWSVAQNVHHLFDAHANGYVRCKLVATEEHPTLTPYDQDKWAVLPDAERADIVPSLTLLTHLHARWVLFWQHLPDEAWQRTGSHPEVGTLTLESLLRTYADHGEAHLRQITQTLAAGGIAREVEPGRQTSQD